jgi:hypothetical protein
MPVDPVRYILPYGFIELTRAYSETVRLRFGESWTREMTPAEEEEEGQKPQSDKTRRSRRWDVTKWCLGRSFLNGALQTFVLQNGTPRPLDPSFWRNWEPSWRPFLVDPMRTDNEPIYLLRHSDLLKWNKAVRPNVARRPTSEPKTREFIASYLRATIDGGGVPTQDGAWKKAKEDGLSPQRERFRKEYNAQATEFGYPPKQGRQGKKRQT